MDRIKELLREWACYYQDGFGKGYPPQSPFVTERVQSSNRDTDSMRQIPDIIARLNDEINGLHPDFRKIVRYEYMDRRPQKTKASVLNIPRQVFSQRLLWIHQQLEFAMFGETVS